jgi:STE24 endopeptidase
VRGWLLDQVKGFFLSTVLLSVLLIPVYAVVRSTELWWLWGALVMMGLQLVMAFVYPVVLMPIFNKFTPLPPGEVRERVDAVARRAGLEIEGAYTMDASRRTRRDNAFVAGFGRTKRVVLYDTLLEHPPHVVEQVVAHEVGHYRLKHLLKSIPFSTLLVLGAFAFTDVLTSWDTLLDWAGVSSVEEPAAVPLFLLGFVLAYRVVGLLQSWRTRWYEREADLEALELLGDPTAFIDTWRRMAPKNRIDLEPTWWRRLQHDHPEVPERMAFGRAWAQQNGVGVDPAVLEPVTLPPRQVAPDTAA